MSNRRILRGRGFVAGAIHDDVVVVIEDGRFADVRLAVRASDPEPNVGGGLMVPGFIDLHVHGAAGADFMDGDAEATRRVCAAHLREGTTALAATTLSASREAIAGALRAAFAVAAEPGAGEAAIVGVNLEGPYLSPAKAGAQDPASLRAASVEEVDFWRSLGPEGLPWIMTVAPEVDGVLTLIEAFHDRIFFSIGHTSADFAQTVRAIDAGARHMTHLFNAMPPLHHRDPGPIGAAVLNEQCSVELIADGIHLHPAILHMMAELFSGRAALVTDAMRACGLSDGTYKLYRHEVRVSDGAARLADGTLAGSILTMRQAVRNMVELAAVPIESVLPFATEVPARLLGIDGSRGWLAAGYEADLVILSDEFEIQQIFCRGHEVSPE
ncbi:MAG: N-acetylglucosamine-6-phosphate deacetylase [Thermoanaerobaculia bacterium]